ncbi:hypothetical protein ACGC1H_002301 [Rhizoctonia solani]
MHLAVVSLLALATCASTAPAVSLESITTTTGSTTSTTPVSSATTYPSGTTTNTSSGVGAPVSVASSTSSAASSTPTVAYAPDDPNDSFWSQFQNTVPVPERGSTGASILGPQNVPLDREGPDFLAPPSTDSGSVENVKWSLSLSHNRMQSGGWARQQNEHDMPIATAMAGVNMRLKAGAMRELHWHTTAEWAYVLAGSCRVTSVDQNGRNYIADVYPGDLWYFPAGIPHGLQGLNDTADGCEFLLVLDSGTFSEDSTFQVTDWLAHVPKEVLAKNFRVNASAFDHIPSRELYMIPSAVPTGTPEEDGVTSPQGTVPLPFSFAASKAPATNTTGGSVKIIDSRTFNISKTISVAEVTVDVGGIRELHWHPT